MIRTIVDKLPEWGTADCVCWMEVDPTHPKLLEDMLSTHPALLYGGGYEDAYGKPRFVKIKFRPPGI